MEGKFNIDEYRLEGLWKIFAEKLEFDTKDMEQRPAYYETVKQAFKYGILTFYAQVLMSPVLHEDEKNTWLYLICCILMGRYSWHSSNLKG